ncbi:glycoside hydrolase family 16 protein [Streptodolium elevatio]
MTQRATAPGSDDGETPRVRARKWAIGAAAAALVVVAPIVMVADAVSDRGESRSESVVPDLAGGDGAHPGWELTWYDEFDGGALDGGKWITCLSGYDTTKPCKGATDGEQQKYVPEQVRVADGALQLTAERKPTDGLPFASGAVSTGARAGESFDASRQLFHPGMYVEARVRLAPGAAMWPAMWLMPKVPKAPYLPEIDVFEFAGDQRIAQARLHTDGPCRTGLGEERGERECYGELARAGTYFADEYHLFGIDWQADRLTYYADGEPVLSVLGGSVPREQMYLIFNLAVGGTMGGDTAQTPAKSTMSIDYVRAWAGSGQVPVGIPNDAGTGGGAPPATLAPTALPPSPPAPSSAAPSTGSAPPTTTTPPPPVRTTNAPTTSSPRPPKPPASSAAPPPPPSAPQGDPWLEFLAPADYSTVRGIVTVRVRVNGPRDRVQEVSFYLNSKDCNSPKGDATWIGYDRDDDNDGVYVISFDSRRLDNGCNTVSTVGIDVADEYRYYPPVGRVHLDVYVAN